MSELYIGLMSGTSMDAIDAALIDFSDGIRLAGTHSHRLPAEVRRRLAELCQSGHDEIDRMGCIDVELGRLFADTVQALLASSEHHAGAIRAIGSHGQTIRHRPLSRPAFTLQIGDPNTIAEQTGISVVADFRRRDMAAGGQGAPLVPAFHAGVFSSAVSNRIVLNLGGIANITVIPAGRPELTFGFDTGPANTLLDGWCQLKKNQPFDSEGEWATSGDTDHQLLAVLLEHPFLSRPHPKSTGREEFHLDWLQQVLSQLGKDISATDVQATLLEFTARTAADAIISSGLGRGELLLCGGGAFNTALWRRLQELLPAWKLHSTADFGLAPGWVEATAFAWLARQTILGLPGNLPAVTGAAGPRVLGAIYPA